LHKNTKNAEYFLPEEKIKRKQEGLVVFSLLLFKKLNQNERRCIMSKNKNQNQSNNDRSNSKNPNNAGNKATKDNRSNQLNPNHSPTKAK
jgi:hypothetical protein